MTGKSLTPLSQAEDVSSASFNEGLIAGAVTMVPTSAAVWCFMRTSPGFRKATNWQSRTALVIMPPLFAFAWAGETNVNKKMHEMASEAEHASAMAEWHHGQQQQAAQQRKMFRFDGDHISGKSIEDERKVVELYRQNVENEGVRVVSGDTLGIHHRIANFWQANPFKVLAFMGVPTVAYIFRGRQQQSHLQLQSQIMHTRVIGQFAVITLLLTLMGFKTYMDNNGTFITEADAERRVQRLAAAQKEFVEKLELEKKREQHVQFLMKNLEEARQQEELEASKKQKGKKGTKKKYNEI